MSALDSDAPGFATTSRSTPTLYGPEYYRGATESNYRDYMQQKAVLEGYWIPLIERYRRILGDPAGGLALDVGCAYGFLVDALRRGGWQAAGCDVSEYAIDKGRRLGFAGLRHGALDSLDYPTATFDLVTCLDVIEHLDPSTYQSYVSTFHRVLKPGGVLFVATPNGIDCSGYNVFSSDWTETDATHVNYRSVLELASDFRGFERVIIHGATPMRGQFLSYRPFHALPRKVNGLIRWLLWRLLANDVQHSAYLLLAARR